MNPHASTSTALRSLDSVQARNHPPQLGVPIMAHTISLGAALLMVLLAIVLLVFFGIWGLLFLIIAAVLFWYAFGPGARTVVVSN